MSEFTPITSFGAVPDGWIWGTATAAHQIEGGNTNNDWWRFEHTEGSGCAESSGDGCDSFNRWAEDLALVKELGLDAYRFSIEWSRIEPAQGEISHVALAHYREQMVAAHELGLKNVVTFHHFTTPLWAADLGGWTNPEIVTWFADYCRAVVEALGDLVDVACTINEPNMVAMIGHFAGAFPPGIKDMDAFREASKNLRAAHEAARVVLKEGPGEFPVGITVAVVDNVLHLDGSRESEGLRAGDLEADSPLAEWQWLMSDIYLESARGDDFIGVQTYSTHHIGPDGQELPRPEGFRVTQMDWPFTPEAVGHTVRYAAQYTGVPVIVTENGVATADDTDRVEYISRALASVRSAMDDGVDVRGYFYWSLLDNFEWAAGYRPTFGIAAVDRTSFARELKPSARYYASLVADSRPAE